ncbi:prolipoprotein diacylglyceryl transferase [Alloscardovia theropitheci]|uniref:Phosphatidylglycerol--prolipoprotein diacylglyceryl transferase n=1 Tax=Alloscardovia theropitheci TaxID=2496842 RepID=A0A4R0QYE6_9BIFI|nr:prolipoprotein diacylglyceryl transferase [Alloscardovia theropitheci]TCD54800.1 prolipoprotein diacylglyceryl transferase [Alloscardovia theropitheci]
MNLAYIPSPSISSFNLGPLTIRFYALAILVGICVAVYTTSLRWKRVGGTFDQILDVTIVAVPTGIIGARLYHVITTPELYFGPSGNFGDIFRIWNGGLGIWGAVTVGALAVWGWCRYKKYPIALLLDAVAPGLLIAQGIGRLGNWFNQELYGSPTTLPWGLRLNDNASAIGASEACYDGSSCPSGVLYHPTFLYEMIWNFIGAALLIVLGKIIIKRFKAGTIFVLYVMWYTAGRAWIEMLRIDRAHEILGLRVNVWVSLLVFMLAVVAFVLVQRMSESTAELSDHLTHVSALEAQVTEGTMTSHQLRVVLNEEESQERETVKKQRSQAKHAQKEQQESEKALYEEAKRLVTKARREQTVNAESDGAVDTDEKDDKTSNE